MKIFSMYLALEARKYRSVGFAEMSGCRPETYEHERGKLLFAYGNFLRSLALALK